MSDSANSTPRSERHKKRSHLSKLAAKKRSERASGLEDLDDASATQGVDESRTSPDTLHDEEKDTFPTHPDFNSRVRDQSHLAVSQNDQSHLESSIVKLGNHMSHLHAGDLKIDSQVYDSQESGNSTDDSMRNNKSLDQSINSQFRDLNMTSSTLEDTLQLSHNSLKRVRDKGSSGEDSEGDRPRRKHTAHAESDESTDQYLLNAAYSDQLSNPPVSRRLNRLERRVQSAQNISDGNGDTSIASRTFASTACLQSLSTSEMKRPTFLVGSMASGASSALGAQELERLLPESKLNIMVLTWNMNSVKPSEYPETLEALLLPDEVEFLPEVFVICLQEATSDKQELLVRLQATLGPNYVLLDHCILGYLAVCVFLRRDLIWFVSVTEKASVNTRPAMNTKGAACISFMIFGSSFLFLSSHFKSDDGNFAARVEDYKKISSTLDLPKIVIQNAYHAKGTDVTTRFDNVFWSGDLNFRLIQKREIVERVINKIKMGETPNFEEMLAGDELLKAQSEGQIFQEFEEGRINFPPTYKYDIHREAYDTSEKLRIPSYTDRILFRCKRKRSVNCLFYNHVASMCCSDHRPVYGVYEVKLKPGSDRIPLSAGAFNRDVYIEGNRRRALQLDVTSQLTREKSSRVCSVM